jgi:glycosyltransferase involved in cell wall biosynthesis
VYKFTTLSNGADFTGVGEGEARTSLDELAKKMRHFMENPVKCDFRQIVKEHYDWDKIADQTMDLYRSLLK